MAKDNGNISYTAKIISEKDIIYDLRVKLNDENRYFILKVNPEKHLELLSKIEADNGYTIEKYGEILYRGWDEPSDELRVRLRELYGMYEKA